MKKTISEINKIPYLTWNWLKMNRSSLELEVSDEISSDGIEILNQNENVKIENLSGETKIVAEGKSDSPVLIHFDFENGKNYLHSQTIEAKENSEITVVMDYTSAKDSSGFSEIRTNLHAEKNSKITLVKVQLLGEKFVQIDDTSSECAENACIDVVQIELGGSKIYAQVKNDLNGVQSKFTSETAFIAKNEQIVDMNYVVNFIAPKSETKMSVKGVVADKAQKIYRGTMDFRNGCAGAKGDEQEETLLMSENVVNKSIPMILCGEDNVEGSHGATLGRLGADELFYMESRGISESGAKTMMAKAKILSTASLIPDESLRKKIEDYVDEK